MKSGNTFGKNFVITITSVLKGSRDAENMGSVEGKIDDERFEHVQLILENSGKRSSMVEKCMCSFISRHFQRNQFLRDLRSRIKHWNIMKAWSSLSLLVSKIQNFSFVRRSVSFVRYLFCVILFWI